MAGGELVTAKEAALVAVLKNLIREAFPFADDHRKDFRAALQDARKVLRDVED